MELTELVGSEAPFPSPEGRESLVELSITCDELIEHFMDEEGALFRLVRDHIPEQADAVDRLEAEHDTIWGAVIRPTASCGARLEATCDAQMAFARFERLYTAHARAKIELIDALMGVLDFAQRALVAARRVGSPEPRFRSIRCADGAFMSERDRETSGNLVPGSLVDPFAYDKTTKRAGHPQGATSDAGKQEGTGVAVAGGRPASSAG